MVVGARIAMIVRVQELRLAAGKRIVKEKVQRRRREASVRDSYSLGNEVE